MNHNAGEIEGKSMEMVSSVCVFEASWGIQCVSSHDSAGFCSKPPVFCQ